MAARFVDWIWHVRGTLTLPVGQSGDEAFDRLDPLFRERGTRHERTGDMLTFSKQDQAAQDKMSVFDSGVLQVDRGVTGLVLRYHLISKALLFCFLAPLLFLGAAQLTIVLGNRQAAAEDADKSAKAAKEAEEKKAAARKAAIPMNPIDKALGAPAPDSPAKKAADKAKAKDKDKKPSPTPAYVFAAIFAVLYGVGRVLEDRLVNRLFERRLHDR